MKGNFFFLSFDKRRSHRASVDATFVATRRRLSNTHVSTRSRLTKKKS